MGSEGDGVCHMDGGRVVGGSTATDVAQHRNIYPYMGYLFWTTHGPACNSGNSRNNNSSDCRNSESSSSSRFLLQRVYFVKQSKCESFFF